MQIILICTGNGHMHVGCVTVHTRQASVATHLWDFWAGLNGAPPLSAEKRKPHIMCCDCAFMAGNVVVSCFRGLWAGVDGDRPLIMDSSYRWSKDNYSRTRRNLDIWSFILTLRARLFLLDKPWSYPGGFTEEKYVQSPPCLL
jgi:hypothetical protein